jgi:hypothetical protein
MFDVAELLDDVPAFEFLEQRSSRTGKSPND